jgi:hypothetical protein
MNSAFMPGLLSRKNVAENGESGDFGSDNVSGRAIQENCDGFEGCIGMWNRPA